MSDIVTLPHTGVIAVLEKIFETGGASAAEASAVANGLVMANLSGHDSHGVIRTPRYVEAGINGTYKYQQTISAVIDTDSFALVDGNAGLGHWVGGQAVDLGIKKAKANGVSVIGLRHAGHIGRIGGWAEQALEAGLVSIHFVNVSNASLVAPFGGKGRRMSTAPVAIGIPNENGEDFFLDFATSRIAEGKALVALKGQKKVAHGDVVDGDGKPSDDPSVLYGDTKDDIAPNPRVGEGALVAVGDHKGSGLALACELLAGAITGNGPTGIKSDPGVYNGMLSVYVDPARMNDGHDGVSMVSQYIDWVRNCPPADPAAPVMVPGDPERKARADRMANGMPLSAETWDNILASGDLVGLSREDLLKLV